MAVALQTGADRIEIGKLEDDREYWQRKLRYEKRRQQQDDLAQRAADEKRELMRLQERIEAVEATMSQLERTRRSLTDEMRQERAEAFRASAEAAREQAEKHEARAEAARPGIDPWLTLLQSMQPLQEALWERVLKEYNTFHFQRMQTLLDRERQQVNALLNTAEVIVFSIMRQATLERRLANLYVQCADVLVPPAPSFRERHAQLINAGKILLVAVGLSYVVKLLIVLAQRLAGLVGDAVGRGRFSVKRVATLLSFMSSILRLFVWVFAIVGVLNEYGIDPVKSTGAIGLVGLILVGMFQQIVIDFVKGLDIVTGRHYNVGDYVELDGKTGHVIDFSVKHTRIRTASGQEYNLPNSRCIPSRRFPDGYVDNYVDIPLKSSADAQRARRAIAPVCRHLSRRIEQVKEQPEFVERFSGNRPNSLVLRYRVRVLPSCDWIITDRFLPDVKAALAAEEIELADAPTFFFINRIQTFRQLLSRELSEEEILREAKELERPTIERAPAEMPATAAEHAPGAPTPA